MEPTTTDTPQAKRILCIEDERFISELYTRALEKAGYKVDVESNGEAGMQLASNGSYDVILLDIMLPGMNGVDVLYKLKEAGNKAATSKIIITTNLDQKEEVRKKVEELADGYIIKAEVTPKELVGYVQQLA